MHFNPRDQKAFYRWSANNIVHTKNTSPSTHTQWNAAISGMELGSCLTVLSNTSHTYLQKNLLARAYREEISWWIPLREPDSYFSERGRGCRTGPKTWRPGLCAKRIWASAMALASSAFSTSRASMHESSLPGSCPQGLLKGGSSLQGWYLWKNNSA